MNLLNPFPRRWSGAGMGVGLLGGRGGFLVSRFQSFLDSKFLGSLVSEFRGLEFLGFEVARIYQMSISYFLEEIDAVSKIFKNLSDGSSAISGARFFLHVQPLGVPTF